MPVQHQRDENSQQPTPNPWLIEYGRSLSLKVDQRTFDAYFRVLQQTVAWIAEQPDTSRPFQPAFISPQVVRLYIGELLDQGRSLPHIRRVKGALKGFSLWLIDKGELDTDPTEGIVLPPTDRSQQQNRTVVEEQRQIILSLVDSSHDLRGKAIFSLVYWSGCRAYEISHLLKTDTFVEPGNGQIIVRGSETLSRLVPLHETARMAMARYLEQGERQPTSAYTFTSQREAIPVPEGEYDGWRLGTRAIHSWFRTLKNTASASDRPRIATITLLDLRHGFERRAQSADSGMEE